jgi:glycosyltransferase involved in cell wall biosynthesis
MKISVIVPVYQCEEFLPACIESILRQTYQDLEVILVDDGSPDGAGTICDDYAAKDTRIRVIHQANQGVSAARNVGLDMASGDLIAFVDSDDTVEPDMYDLMVKIIQDYEADIAHCGYRKVHFDGSTKEVLGTGVLLVQDAWEASECLLKGKYFTGGLWTKIYRKQLFEGIRFDPELKINEDVWLNVQIFRNARKLVFWDVPKYFYYERAQSATRVTNRLKIKRDCVEAARRMLELYKNTPLENACAVKLHYALLDLYREGLLCDYSGERNARKDIHRQIREVSEILTEAPQRSVWNYRFMRYLPWLYILVYRIFDRIRKPNIDL